MVISGVAKVRFVLKIELTQNDKSGAVFLAIRNTIASALNIPIIRLVAGFLSITRIELTPASNYFHPLAATYGTAVEFGILPPTADDSTTASDYAQRVQGAFQAYITSPSTSIFANDTTIAEYLDTSSASSVTTTSDVTIYQCDGIYQVTSCPITTMTEDTTSPTNTLIAWLIPVVIVVVILAAVLIWWLQKKKKSRTQTSKTAFDTVSPSNAELTHLTYSATPKDDVASPPPQQPDATAAQQMA